MPAMVHKADIVFTVHVSVWRQLTQKLKDC